MTLGDAFVTRRTANLDGLRLALAASVIVSHAWPLALGPVTPEPLEALTGHSLGGWAVAMFFFLSGLLVSASAERRTASEFWLARARRIFPGLGVALLVTLLLAVASGATARPFEATMWFVRALTLVSIEHRLTDAFAGNPLPQIVNGPLWSLFHEVVAYGVCWLFVLAGGTQRRGRVAALVILAGVAALVASEMPGRVATFAPLFAAFAIGMAAYVFRHVVRLTLFGAALCLPLVLIAPWPIAVAALGYAGLALSLRAPALRLGGDYSFGLYIYGWPVAQVCMQAFPGLSPAGLAVLSLAATIPFAVASWRVVEQPALAPRRAAA